MVRGRRDKEREGTEWYEKFGEAKEDEKRTAEEEKKVDE